MDSLRIAIDARWMVDGCRGMGRHARHLIAPVIENVIGLVPSGSQAPPFHFLRSGPRFYPAWEQVWLPFACSRLKAKYLVCPYNTAPLFLPRGTRLILVVHDLIFMSSWSEVPPSDSLFQELGRLYRRIVLPLVINKAHRVVTVSKHSREQLVSKMGLCPKKIVVINNAIGSSWFDLDPLPYETRKSYILCVAGEAPSKNLQKLIEAFGRLKQLLDPNRKGMALRIVGVKPQFHSRFLSVAEVHQVGGDTVMENYLEQKALMELYRQASLFVLPSLHEGFGIPLIEAMASGTPIACSNTSALPEILRGCGYLFNPREPEEIAQAMLKALTDPIACKQHIKMGLQRAKEFKSSRIESEARLAWEHMK